MINTGPISNFIANFLFFLNYSIVPLIFALAFFGFLYGVYHYFFALDADTEKRAKGRTFVLYSVIGFFIMVSIWGILNILTGTLGFNGYARPALPLFGTVNQTTTSNTSSTTTNSAFQVKEQDTECLDGEHWDANAARDAFGDKGMCVKN